MILAQSLPKTAKSSWQCPFNELQNPKKPPKIYSQYFCFCHPTSIYIFISKTSLSYRNFNFIFRKTCLINLKKKKILLIGITVFFNFASLRNFGHPQLFPFLVFKHYSKPTQDVNLSVFIAYKRESWSTNARNLDLQWKDDLHLIWYRLHSACGAMFHSRFLVLQTVSSQANQKVIHCCCYYLRWNIIKSLVITRETGQ